MPKGTLNIKIIATTPVHSTVRFFQSRFGLWLVGVISFVESTLPVPIITDPFLVVYILVNYNKTSLAVLVTTLASVLGGVTAYGLAFFFSDFVLSWLSGSSLEYFNILAQEIRTDVFVLTILGAITPIPYTLVALATGFVKANLIIFMVASVLGRGLRYLVVGYLTYKFGIQATKYIKRYLKLLTVLTFVIVGLYSLYKIIF